MKFLDKEFIKLFKFVEDNYLEIVKLIDILKDLESFVDMVVFYVIIDEEIK